MKQFDHNGRLTDSRACVSHLEDTDQAMAPILGTEPLNVAVVGLGVGRQHALAFAADPRCRVRWLYDQSVSQAKKVAGQIPSASIADSFDQIVQDPDTHVVSIATFDDDHAQAVEAALAWGKHVFVEKPLCRTLDELLSIQETWEQAGRPHLASNLVLRAAPLYQWLNEAIRTGVFGRVYAFDGDYLYGRLEKITEGWRGSVPDYSVMEGGGIHLIDIMCRAMGAEPTAVRTVGNAIATHGTAFQYDDFQAATYRFASGAIGRITANFACVHRHHHVVRVFGTRASFIYDDQGPRLHETRDEEGLGLPIRQNPLPAGKGVLIPDFVNNIVSNADSSSAAIQEFNLIAAVAASDIAHKSGAEEKVRTYE